MLSKKEIEKVANYLLNNLNTPFVLTAIQKNGRAVSFTNISDELALIDLLQQNIDDIKENDPSTYNFNPN